MADANAVAPDRWLLADMARGDPAAARELRRRHAKSLYALAYGLLWDSDVADAVVAQAFDQAARTARECGPEVRTVFGWLAGITRTRAQTAAAAPPFQPPRPLAPLSECRWRKPAAAVRAAALLVPAAAVRQKRSGYH